MVTVVNTVSGEVDNLPNHLAQRLMERTNGLWKEKTQEQEVVAKPTIKRRRRRTRAQIEAGVKLDDLPRVS